MGRLIAKAYRTSMVAYLAEHTYVECGAGAKGWGCWGGKTGGRKLGGADGSTRRADAIAELDERGGITCYAINGVCHQAANRILMPAEIFVSDALGYGASKWMFGPFGRIRGPQDSCSALLNAHRSVSGDLDECADLGPPVPRYTQGQDSRAQFRAIAEQTRALYAREDLTGTSQSARIGFQLAQAEILAMNTLERFREYWDLILNVQFQFESARVDLEDQLADGLARAEFPPLFNSLARTYQADLADALPSQVYVAMMNSPPGREFELCDPEIFALSPGPGSSPPSGSDFKMR